MNWRTGLERISAVWWGFWALLTGVYGVYMFFEATPAFGAGVLFLGLPSLYAAHKLTCWIIAGFFPLAKYGNHTVSHAEKKFPV